MTCIIGIVDKGDIYMGGDTQGTAGQLTLQRDLKKVFIKNNMIFGPIGSPRAAQLIEYSFKIPQHPKKMSDMEYLTTIFINALRKCLKDGGYANISSNVEEGNDFILGYKGILYNIQNDYQVAKYTDNYHSVGSGMYFALGSLYTTRNEKDPIKRIKIGLETASFYDYGVREPFIIECLKGGENGK